VGLKIAPMEGTRVSVSVIGLLEVSFAVRGRHFTFNVSPTPSRAHPADTQRRHRSPTSFRRSIPIVLLVEPPLRDRGHPR